MVQVAVEGLRRYLVLSVAKRLRRRLINMGYRVYMTRSRDVFVKLPKRTEFANKKLADIFVSIHRQCCTK